MLIFTLVSWAAIAAAAAVMPRSPEGFSVQGDLPEGFVEAPITWSGFEVNGEKMAFNGTFQDVIRQIKEIDPGYDFDKHLIGNSADASDYPDLDSERAAKLPPSNLRDTKCGNIWGADASVIYEGVDFLKQLDPSLMCDSSPGSWDRATCGRISCSYEAAIWNCNHNEHHVSYPCRVYGEYAEKATDACRSGYLVGGYQVDLLFGISSWVGHLKSGLTC